MPRRISSRSLRSDQTIAALGQTIRQRRVALGVSATALAEAAGLSRVTLHRLEHGHASVTLGACLEVMAALNLQVSVTPITGPPPGAYSPLRQAAEPAMIRLADYPQLRELAWHVRGLDSLTAQEAAGIYRRNERHIDATRLTERERDLILTLTGA
jgi:transcriptional regulator with XRE-family HTH domain